MLHGAVEDLKRLLQLIPGGSTVDQKLRDFEAYIRAQAKAGAEEAIPTIKDEVKKTVEPFVFASLMLGIGGLLLGAAAFLATRDQRRGTLQGARKALR